MPPRRRADRKDNILRDHGPEGLVKFMAYRAAQKRKTRALARLRATATELPENPIDLRRVLGGHPGDCDCYDCLWGGEAERPTRTAKWPERIRL